MLNIYENHIFSRKYYSGRTKDSAAAAGIIGAYSFPTVSESSDS
jgi:hypothetical protein